MRLCFHAHRVVSACICLERGVIIQEHTSVDEASRRSVMLHRNLVCAAIRRNSSAANLDRKRESLTHDASTHAGISHSRSLRRTVACVIALVGQPQTGDDERSIHVVYLQPSSSLITFLPPPAAASGVTDCIFATGDLKDSCNAWLLGRRP